MKIAKYDQFVQLVLRYKIFPFSDFVPEFPSLPAVAPDNWHSDTEDDPWAWRIRIARDGVAAYGKFFGSKAAFIHISLVPAVRAALTANRSVEERYRDGLVSSTAYRLYQQLAEHGNTDSRKLRKLAGLEATEAKKEYEKALVELQNSLDVVITGSRESDNAAGWNSMCYELADDWLGSVKRGAGKPMPEDEAKSLLKAELSEVCTAAAYKYFAKKLRLN